MISVVAYSRELQDEVIELILAIQQQEFGFDIQAADQSDLLEIASFYQSGTGGFWVALADENVVGTIALRDIGNQQGALRKMFVKAPWRGREFTVASSLLSTLLRSASENGVERIFLGTTEKFLAAHRFYEKSGFERVAESELPPAFPRMALDTRFYKLTLSKAVRPADPSRGSSTPPS